MTAFTPTISPFLLLAGLHICLLSTAAGQEAWGGDTYGTYSYGYDEVTGYENQDGIESWRDSSGGAHPPAEYQTNEVGLRMFEAAVCHGGRR